MGALQTCGMQKAGRRTAFHLSQFVFSKMKNMCLRALSSNLRLATRQSRARGSGNPHPVNRILLYLALLCLAVLARGADADSRELFALYPVVPKGTAGAKAFSFQVALSEHKRSGFYGGSPILTVAELE